MTRQPARVVLDSTLRIPPAARVLARDGAPVTVATTSRARPERRQAIEALGADVIVADGPDGRVDLRALCEALGRRGVMSLLVEGGGAVHGAFMDAGRVDKVLAFLAPVIVGGPAPGPVGGAGVDRLAQAWRLTRMVIRQVEQDYVIEGYIDAGAHATLRPAGDRAATEAEGTACSPAS